MLLILLILLFDPELLLLLLHARKGFEPMEVGMSVELFHVDFFDLDVGNRPPGPLLSNLNGLECELGVPEPSVGVAGGMPISIFPIE